MHTDRVGRVPQLQTLCLQPRVLPCLAAPGAPKVTAMNHATLLWRIASMHMAAFNGVVARKALPDWRRRELRAIAETRLNDYFNEIDRIIALNATPDTHRREATG